MTVTLWDVAADALDPPAPSPRRWATPGAMAQTLDPRTVQTRALELIDQALVELADTPDGRRIITLPPQEGKTVRCAVDFPTWWLVQHPDDPIVVASYGQALATRNGRAIRRRITEHPELGLTIAPDNGAANEWMIAGHDGGVFSVGIGGGLTGRPSRLMVIDDPIKDRKEADSETFRQAVWDWWTDVASARLAPGAPVVVILCMTGDTPVLMADGSERLLRDISLGDKVATYEDGRLSTSTVRRWACQGPDRVLTIRMKSGVKVRANARHPFLTIEGCRETWRRTDELWPGSVILRATGESGAESSVQSMGASRRPGARECACRTTARRGGLLVTDLRQSTPSRAVEPSFVTATVSTPRTTTDCSLNRAGSVRSADVCLRRQAGPSTGPVYSASTTNTRPDACADCSATTATSSSGLVATSRCCSPPLSTYAVIPDEVVEVVEAGVEDVYDVQIDRTENFIAAGLVSHNTRWHEDDLAGRLVADDEFGEWQVLNIPAQADHDPGKGETDLLDREPGEFMESARRRSVEQWERRKRTAGARSWEALYQGRPGPVAGSILQRSWWSLYDTPRAVPRADGSMWLPGPGRVVTSWDMAFKGTDSANFVAGQVWSVDGANVYLLDQVHARLSFVETLNAFVSLAARWPQANAHYIEDKANGPAVMSMLRNHVPGLLPVEPQGSKTARAHAIAPLVQAGNVHLPHPRLAPWVDGLITEAASFPYGANDDQVDALTQAVSELLLNMSPSKDSTTWYSLTRNRAG